MARTVFPVVSKSNWPSVTTQSTLSPQKAQASFRRQRSLATAGQVTPDRSEEEQNYLERVQNYIPAEIVALFIFINSLVSEPRDADGNVTSEGWVALAAVVVSMIGCVVLARVAAKQAGNPAYKLQAFLFTIALLIWIYAMDAKVLVVLKLEPIPALSGLLLVTFTLFSGLVVPSVKAGPAGAGSEGGDQEGKDPVPAHIPHNLSVAPAATVRGDGKVSHNPSHFCMCLRNKPGHQPIAGAERGAVLREAKWTPGSAISVTFLSGSATLKQRVRAVAEEWVAPGMANLSFRWVDDPEADIRIDFIQGDGSWSYLGTVCRQIASPKPTMNYGWLTDDSAEDDLRRVVLHEFGHALGMIHEHQNPDGGIKWNEAAVIADLKGPPNNWDENTIHENVLKKYDPDALNSTEVDPTSIMMYPIPASWTDGAFSAGLNGELSNRDKQLIRQEYP